MGAAIAKHLFPILGAEGTVAVRIIISALLLVLAMHGRLSRYRQIFIRNWTLLLLFGFCVAAMNFFFYKAIARIPLGTAVAIEFIGPLGVAALTSRRLSHIVWVTLAAVGIVLLTPLSGGQLDNYGIIFALLAGTGWAFFIILAGRLGNRVSGNDGLVIGMIIAALTMIPFATPVINVLFSDPLVLLASLGVALLSTTIPFILEFEALKRVSARTYGILVSVEPAVAAMVGAVLLEELLEFQSILAIGCIVIAAIGITATDRSPRP